MKRTYSVAVIGGGITGCVAALSLADQGHRVWLFERSGSLMGGASLVNEGKIHLGFVYVNDPSLRSLDVMIQSAVVFRPLLERWIRPADFDALVTDTFEYIVPTDSQVSPEVIEQKFRLIEAKINEAESLRKTRYLGMARSAIWSRTPEVPESFNPGAVLAHFRTLERSVDTHAIAALLSRCVEEHNRIELHLKTPISTVAKGRRAWMLQSVVDGRAVPFSPFDYVINAAWDGRLALDEQVFGPETGKWFHRYKTALNLMPETGNGIPNFTAIIGAYGDVVAYPSGRVYLSWYPTGMLSSSSEVGGVKTKYSDEERTRVASSALAGLSAFVPGIQPVFSPCQPKPGDVAGGIIMARGVSDIDDARSELHQRYRIGVRERGGFISIDTGKYTCGPCFAEQAVGMITG